MSSQTRRQATVAGIVPREHAELFGNELRAAFPGRTVTLRFYDDDQGIELWVQPGLRAFELARWARRWRHLQQAVM